MRSKLCISCGPTNGAKPIEQFHYKNKAKGTRQDRCIDCANEYAKKHYEANKEKRLEQINKNQNRVRADNRKLYNEFLTGAKCAVCSEADQRCLTSNITNDEILYRGPAVFAELLQNGRVLCLNCAAKGL